MTTVAVHKFADPLTLADGRRRDVEASRVSTVAEAVRAAWGADPSAVAAVRNGVPVADADLEPVLAGDEVHFAPSVGDPGTAILLAVSIISAVASAALAMSVSVPDAVKSDEPEERRYGFNRFSSDAFAGDVVPAVLGRAPRYGGKRIATVPIESPDGSGDERVKVLVCLGHGPVGKIGNQTADFDDVDGSSMGGLELNDQAVSQFDGVKVSGRMGSDPQAPIRGFEDVESLREVGSGGVDLVNTSGSPRTDPSPSGEAFSFTTISEVNAFRVRVRLPRGLYAIDNDAQVEEQTVAYRVRWRPDGGSWGDWSVITLTRSDQSALWSSPLFEVGPTAETVEIEAERVTPDNESTTVVDELRWDSVVEITDAESTYAGYALLALEITAGEQLQSVPRVSVDVDGVASLRIWDGVSDPSEPEFVAGFSDNPADLALELLTNTTWGMGAVYGDDAIDFESLLEWRSYCAEPVERPDGGSRPRFRFGMALDAQRDGVEWLRAICAAGRCVPVTAGGVWRFIVDRPAESPAEVFTDGSIAVDDQGVARFTYRRELATGGLRRPNQLVAQFANERERGKPDTLEYPRAGELWLADESPRRQDLRLDGVTDPDQVAAELVYRMSRQRLVTRSVSFVTTKPVVVVQPGERFDLAMSLPGYAVASGRLLTGTTKGAAVLDRAVELEAATVYRLRVVHLDNSIEVMEIDAPAGAYARGAAVSLAGQLAQKPEAGAEWALEVASAGATVRPFVCTGVSPVDAERLLWQIEGVEYVAAVFGDEAGAVDLPGYTTLDDPLSPPGPVVGLTALERADPATGDPRIALAWEQGASDASITSTFRVYRRTVGTATWVLQPSAVVARRSAEVDVYQPDRGYQFVVVPVSVGGSFLSPYDSRHPIASIVRGLAADAPPAPASGSASQVSGNRWRLDWADVEGAAAYVVHGSGSSGNDGEVNRGAAHALTVGRPIASELDLEMTQLAERFYVRAVGANGRMSASALVLDVANVDDPPGLAEKLAVSVDFAGTGTLTNATAPSGVFTPTDPSAEASWESGTIDTGSDSLTTVLVAMHAANQAGDPAIDGVAFVVPSVEADQWGIVDGSRAVGMLFPPAPDDRVEAVWEISYDEGGGVYSDWSEVPRGGHFQASFRYARVRVRVSRGAAPYALGIDAARVEFHD